jgi:RND family efflux transporter MFP subunit
VKNKMKYKWLWIFLLLLVVAVSWRIFSKQGKNNEGGMGGRNGRNSAAVAVETGKVQVMDISDTGNYSGSLSAKSSYLVAPKVSGQLTNLYVNIGQTVSKGQLIAELDDRVFAQEVEKAKAAVAMAQANAEQTADAMAQSERDLADKRELFSRDFISQNEFSQANSSYIANKARHNVAQASLQSALAALQSAEIQLSYTKIKADWNGGSNNRVIGEKFVDQGTMLNAGSPIVSVLEINTLIAVVSVIEEDYTRLKVGQSVTISTDTWKDMKFPGRVARLAPQLDESSRQARVEVEVANPGLKLKPGMFARVEVNFYTKRAVKAIPAAALYKYQDEEGIFLVNNDNTVSFVPVQKGIVTADFIEIVSPELNGEVVTLGQDMLEDGKKIELPGQARDKKGRRARV